MRINPLHVSAVALGVMGAACVSAPSSAYAGEWRFHPELCRDLVEDVRDRRESRRDERFDYGPRDVIEDRLDRRESRRDERVTVCPARAWVWHGGNHYRRRAARPAAINVYYDHHHRHYYRHGPKKVRVRVVVR